VLVGYCLAQRGEEITKIVLHGLTDYFEMAEQYAQPHIMIPLLGRFKNEVGEQYHFLPVAAETKS